MVYPVFPTGGAGDRPMWFSTFDPRYMLGALNVLRDNSAAGAYGGGAIYNTNNADPPALWKPSFPMFMNAGLTTRTSPVVWAHILGPKRAFLLTYAGGQIPD
jgi:hypothetical protein